MLDLTLFRWLYLIFNGDRQWWLQIVEQIIAKKINPHLKKKTKMNVSRNYSFLIFKINVTITRKYLSSNKYHFQFIQCNITFSWCILWLILCSLFIKYSYSVSLKMDQRNLQTLSPIALEITSYSNATLICSILYSHHSI
jgi:predicted ferric reductase